MSSSWAAGPWTVGTGVASLYVGVDGDHYRNIGFIGANGPTTAELGDGLSSFGMHGIFSYGLTPRLQFDAGVQWRARHMSRKDTDFCDIPSLSEGGPCADTRGINSIDASLKAVVLDEVAGSPVGLSISATIRYGGLVANTRSRLTAIGDGTTDFGPVLSIGRSTALGAKGSGSASATVGWFYRIPNTHRFPLQEGDRNVPGSELTFNAEVAASPNSIVSVGPFMHGHHELAGVGFAGVERSDFDRFVALRSTEIAAGLKLVVTDKSYNNFSLSASRVVWGRNTLIDTTRIGVGVSLHNFMEQKRKTATP